MGVLLRNRYLKSTMSELQTMRIITLSKNI